MANDTLESIWNPTQAPASQPGPSSSAPSSSAPSLSSIWGNQSQASSETPTQPQDLSDIWGGAKKHDESDRFTEPDPNANWLEKSWSFLNKPLTESIFGWGQYRSGAGGLERGVEKIASGLTSPLSLGLLAAFAPAGIVEGVAGSALKEGLIEGADALGGEALDTTAASLKVENYAKAMQAAKKAEVGWGPGAIEKAVYDSTGGSMPYQEFKNFGEYLKGLGLRDTDMLNESLARRVASSGLRKAGLTADKALNVAKGAETLVNAGFGIQQIHGAIYAYPRVMDLLSKGDYDDAAEYMVEAGAGTVFGGLGLAHSLYSVHDLIPGVNEKSQLAINDENKMLQRLVGRTDGEIADALNNNNNRMREMQAKSLDAIDHPVPANLKVGSWKEVGLGSEIKSAWDAVVGNKAQSEKLRMHQIEMFMRLDNGNDPVLSHQQMMALTHAYNLQDWAKDNTSSYTPPTRKLEDIQTEENNLVIRAKTDASENAKVVDRLNESIDAVQENIKLKEKLANPQEVEGLRSRLKDLTEERDERTLAQEDLDKEYEKQKEWENPTEETWQKHYNELNNKLQDAWKNVDHTIHENAVDQFNQKIRALAWNPNDINLIEEKYPHFRDAYKAPEPAGNYADTGLFEQLAQKAYGSGGIGQEDLEKLRGLYQNYEDADVAVKDYLESGTTTDKRFHDLKDEFDIASHNLKEEFPFFHAQLADYESEAVDEFIDKHANDIADFLKPEAAQRAKDHPLTIEDFKQMLLEHKQDQSFPKIGPQPEAILRKTEDENFKNWFKKSKIVDDKGRPLVLYHGTRVPKEPVYSGPALTPEDLVQKIAPMYQKNPELIELAHSVIRAMRQGSPFSQAMERFGTPELAYALGGEMENSALDFPSFNPDKGDLGTHVGSVEQSNSFTPAHAGAGLKYGRILPVFVRMENPLRLTDYGGWHGWGTLKELEKKGIISSDEFNRFSKLSDTPEVQSKIRKAIENKGYDGIVYLNRFEGRGLKAAGAEQPSLYSTGPLHAPDPEFSKAYPDAHDSYILFHPEQAKSVFNSGAYSESPDLLANRIYPPKLTEADRAELSKQIDTVQDQISKVGEGFDKVRAKYNARKPSYEQAEKLIADYAKIQHLMKGDSFATEEEMKFGLSDPVGSWGGLGGELNSRINQWLEDNGYKYWKWGHGGFQLDETESPEYQAVNKKVAKLANTLDRLQTSYERGVPGNYMGEVHKLPDGKKVLYLPLESLNKIQRAMGFRKLNLGEQVPSVLVTKALMTLETTNPDLYRLVEQAQNSNGDVVISRTPAAHGGKIANKLHTLREELNHSWQGGLAKSYAHSHLPSSDFQSLAKELDKGIVKHLNWLRYTKDPATRVVEAAAKMMSVRDLSTIGTTPENAAAFLNKYFTAIKNRHGIEAFDNLTHVTTFAKKLKEDFVNANRPETGPEPTSGPGETTEPMGGVGEGGGEGTPPPPPPGPTGPPEPPFDWRGAVREAPGYPNAPWLDGGLHSAHPDDIIEKVDAASRKNFKPEQVEYMKDIIKVLDKISTQQMTPKIAELYKTLRNADDDNWAVGSNHNIIHSIVDNHIHHIWGDKEGGNNTMQHAASGAYSINAAQARHRSWGTAFEGFLAGRQLKVHDPVSIISHDAANIATAVAHRNFIEALRDSGLKDPEGMPVVTFMGRGNVVPGVDKTKSSLLVNPNAVRNIMMSEADVKNLTDSKLLDSYIKAGKVVDQTPQVSIDNVKEWIKDTQTKIGLLEKKNPLLVDSRDNLRDHEAGWGQLQLFAREQAGKIADYLDSTIAQITKGDTIDGKNYAPWDPADKPKDLSMAKYLDSVLHGGSGRKISPADIQRLEEYSERNRDYADGKSSYKDSPIRPHEVARLLLQEKDHLDPELTKYLNDVHGKLGTNWDLKGTNSALYHIAHVAENPHYKQLHQDLLDLKWVDNVLSSEQSGVYPWKEVKTRPPISPQTVEQNRAEAVDHLKEINARQQKQYLWAPKQHITIDHPSFSKYKWMATASDGTPTLAESDMAVSRYYYRYLVNRLGLEPSWLRKPEGLGKITAPLLKVGAEAKSAILSGSPFHVMQEVLRAAMLWTNPFVRPNPIEDLNATYKTVKGDLPLMRLGVNNGLTLFSNRFEAEDYAVGVASHGGAFRGALDKVPVVGHYLRYSDQIHDLLFNRLIPSYKASGFRKMFDKYASAHPEWSDDAVAHAAATHVNNAFGGQNWREMGRSAATQDWFHLIALAPDWLESEMRFAAGLFKGAGIGPAKYEPEHGRNFSREQVAGTAAALWVSMRLLNQLYSGNAHYETPFGLATKDKDGREVEFSVRTMPTDILHMATDPMGFLNGRMSPFLRTEEEIRTGRNQYDQKLSDGEKYVDLVSNLVPIWGQSGLKDISHLATASDVGLGPQLAKAGGLTAQVFRTPAQKEAAKLASERSEGGPINQAQISHHRLILQLEDQMRQGNLRTADLSQMVDQGNLPEADAKAIIKNVKETAGEDPETARLYSRVSRLDFGGALTVWDTANPSEKQVLEKLITKKAKSYLKKARKDFTPAERAEDPIFKRAQRIAPVIESEE